MSSSFIEYKTVYPKLEILAKNLSKIREEYLSNKNLIEFRDFTEQQRNSITHNKKGFPITIQNYLGAKPSNQNSLGWNMAGIFGGGIVHPTNGSYLPTLVKILTEVGNISTCGINMLDSGASLDWHRDDDYSDGMQILRTLWGLDVPKEEGRSSIFQIKNEETGEIETREFENDGVYAFWPETIHRVENNMTQSRAVIAVSIIINR